jgi:hypothetical protein
MYDKFKAGPVTLGLTLAVTDAVSQPPAQIELQAHDVLVPGFGVCWPVAWWINQPGEFRGVNSRSAMRQPPLAYVSTHWSQAPCPSIRSESAESDPSAGVLGKAWEGSLDQEPVLFGITSVWETPLIFLNSSQYSFGTGNLPRHLCLGSVLTFTEYTTANKTQFAISIPDFHLPPLSIGSAALVFSTQ